jgi:hypothetical protein
MSAKKKASPVLAVLPGAHPKSPTAGIQEAIDSLLGQGGVVLLRNGTYPVRRSLCMRSGVTLRGEGAATVLLRPAPVYFDLTTPSPAEVIEAGLSTVKGLKVGDEIWICDATQGGWHSRHIGIERIKGGKVSGALLAGDAKRRYTPEGGAWGGNFFPMIYIHGCADARIESLAIDGGQHGYDAGRIPDFTCCAVHGYRAEDLVVRSVIVRRWPGDGIGAQGGSASVTDCIAEDGLSNGFHPGTSLRRSLWANNVARRNGWDGFYFCLNVRNAVVANNHFIENRRHGIGGLAAPDAYNVITGNVIARNARRGIDAPQCLGNVISNNLIQDNSQSLPGAFAGIALENHSGNTVTGNVCIDTQKSPTQAVGIEAFNALGENVITGNLTPAYPTVLVAPLARGVLRRTSEAPEIDGRLDEAAWTEADALVLDRRAEDGAPVSAAARALFLRDDAFLYIGIRCDEPRMDLLRDVLTARGADAWRENSVEIFIDPGTGMARCHQLAVNSLGALYSIQHAGTASSAWDSRARVAAHRGKDFWSAELAVPLEALAAAEIKPGTQWRVNVCRSRLTCTPHERSAWSTTFGGFTVQRRMGVLMAT